MGELVPHDEKAVSNRKIIQSHKDRAIIPTLDAIATEIEARAKSGKLTRELKGMKVSSLLGNLTRIISAIKDAAPVVVIPGGKRPPDETWLKANSAVRMNPADREKARLEAKIVDAELIEEPNGKEVDPEAEAKEGSLDRKGKPRRRRKGRKNLRVVAKVQGEGIGHDGQASKACDSVQAHEVI